MNGNLSTRFPARRRTERKACLTVETLEDRCLLSVSLGKLGFGTPHGPTFPAGWQGRGGLVMEVVMANEVQV
jgi:hypothetical protein